MNAISYHLMTNAADDITPRKLCAFGLKASLDVIQADPKRIYCFAWLKVELLVVIHFNLIDNTRQSVVVTGIVEEGIVANSTVKGKAV